MVLLGSLLDQFVSSFARANVTRISNFQHSNSMQINSLTFNKDLDQQTQWITGYDRMFGTIGLAVLSGLGRHETHPGRWIHLPFRDH